MAKGELCICHYGNEFYDHAVILESELQNKYDKVYVIDLQNSQLQHKHNPEEVVLIAHSRNKVLGQSKLIQGMKPEDLNN
jgi:hypothetical protein